MSKPAKKPPQYILSTGVESLSVPMADGGTAAAPVKRYMKQIVRVGKYKHPVDGWEWDVTPDVCMGLASASAAMLTAGVPLEVTVDHSQSARDVVGYVTEPLTFDGEWLWGVHEFKGQENIKLAETCRSVSPEVDMFKDGSGRDYGLCVLRSSIVQKPVVNHQKGFIPMAASLDGLTKPAQVKMLMWTKSTTEPKKLSIKGDAMDEILALLRDLTGMTDLTTENVVERMKGFMEGKDKGYYMSLDGKLKEAVTAKAAVDSELATLKKNLSDAQVIIVQKDDTLKTLSLTGNAKPMDAHVANLLARGYERELDALVKEEKISPAVATDLKTGLLGAAGSRKSLSLMGTSKGADGAELSIADVVISALGKNAVIKMGTATQAQGSPAAQAQGSPAAQVSSGGRPAAGGGDPAVKKTFEQEVAEAAEANKPAKKNPINAQN